MVVSEQSGIMAFVTQYGQVIYFFGQILFWLALSVAAIWATLLFKRLVDFKTAAGEAAPSLIMEPNTPTAEEAIKIEDFVE